MSSKTTSPMPAELTRGMHAMHCQRCLSGLPASQVELDSSRAILAFYCLGTLDLLDRTGQLVNTNDYQGWKEALWNLQMSGPRGTGFRPSSYMRYKSPAEDTYSDSDPPHLIGTYTALLSLAILRDDFARLDRAGVLRFLRTCQLPDGSFATIPGARDADLRLSYCAFAISAMLDDWSGMDVLNAIQFIQRCRTYEGGYGQEPFGEAIGGTTYCALASLQLAATGANTSSFELTGSERRQTIRWLIQKQDEMTGGFSGRTNKVADACYSFWCGASLEMLGAKDSVDSSAHRTWLAKCQFKYGGIAKAVGEHSDPYHTYLSLAALSIFPGSTEEAGVVAELGYQFTPFDTLLNAKAETTKWIRDHVPSK